MAEQAEIERIAKQVVDANTAPGSVVSVRSVPSVDWKGDEVLKISIVVDDERVELLFNQAPLNILTQMRDSLSDAGETRFPIIDYATPAELEAERKELAADDDYPARPAF